MCVVRRSSIPKTMTKDNSFDEEELTNKENDKKSPNSNDCAFSKEYPKKETFLQRTNTLLKKSEKTSTSSASTITISKQQNVKKTTSCSTRKMMSLSAQNKRRQSNSKNDCHIRSRFLSRLGIQESVPQCKQQRNQNQNFRQRLSKRAQVELREPLKYDHGLILENNDPEDENSCASTAPLSFNDSSCSSDTYISSPSFNEDDDDHCKTDATTRTTHPTTSTEQQRSPRQQRTVSFEKSVSVRTIPTRYSYSSRIQKDLWFAPYEVQQNTQRNIMEFAADSWDWKLVREEQDMFYNHQTKEYVHPIHYVNRSCNVRQQFFMVMSAAQQHNQHQF